MVVCLGEAVIDWISTERVDDLNKAGVFHKCLGGSPANVAVGLQAEGIEARLAGKVGRDAFGRFVREELGARGVSVAYLVEDDAHPTRCVFMAYDAAGRRMVTVANRESADQFLSRAELDPHLLAEARVLHLGGTTLLNDTNSATALSIVLEARKQRVFVSFDPNIPLKSLRPEVKARIKDVLPHTAFLKMNAEEESALHASGLIDASFKGVRLITEGAKGAHIVWQGGTVFVPAAPVRCIDPTGAGDAFVAAFLAGLIRREALENPGPDALKTAGREAVSAASSVLVHVGATR